MKKLFLQLFFLIICMSLFSQEKEDGLSIIIEQIREQNGDFAARNYLESKKDSLEQNGKVSSYKYLWGFLTSNLWHSDSTVILKEEYKSFLNTIINEKVKSKDFVPEQKKLELIRQLTSDYYTILYNEGNKENALELLYCIHRWYLLYPDERNTIGYAQNLLDLCHVLVGDMHKYREGEPFCKEYIQVAKTTYGDSSAQYAEALYNLTLIPNLNSEGKIDLLKEALEIYRLVDNKDETLFKKMKQSHDMYIAATTGIASIYDINEESDSLSIEECSMLVISGKGEKVIPHLLKHKELLKNEAYIDTLKYATVVALLINSYLQSNNLASAQKEIDILNDSTGINMNVLPVDFKQLFLSSAGVVSYKLKNYSEALRYNQGTITLFEQAGNFGMEYSIALANIAMTYLAIGQSQNPDFYLDAKWYIDEAVSIFEERVGSLSEHGNMGLSLLNHKALIYEAIGNNEEAIDILESVVHDFSTNIDVKDAWLLAVNNLSAIYMKQGRWADGAKMLEGIENKNDDFNYVKAQNLVLCYLFLNDSLKISHALLDMNRYFTNSIGNVFSYFAGIERENYWSQMSIESIMTNNLAASHTNNNHVISIAYDNTLYLKNYLLNSSIIINKYFAQTLDKELKHNYITYKELREKLAFKTKNQNVTDSTLKELTRYEKNLMESVGDFGRLLKNETKTWKDVQQSLEEDEIAIEFCYAPRMEKYPDSQPYYGAFLLGKNYDYPKFVSLVEVYDVERVFNTDDPDALFINDLYSSEKTNILYKMIWGKLTPYLNDVNTVYYSPIGHLASINFDVLRSEDDIMLNEKYSMIRVSSTANIHDIKTDNMKMLKSSVLYGNIKYDETLNDMIDASSFYNTFSGIEIESDLALRSENERGKWGAIPSTKKEIDNISNLLSQKGIRVSKFEGKSANEESFKKIDGHSPDILHIATHGFVIYSTHRAEGNKFVESTNVYSPKDSYMMWTGLIFAGGNNIWQGNFKLHNVEDGILTADEISRLNLGNTKLIVLSACETARGKIDPVDGVYGLQRAFKIAGVKTIVMSLWKVQDDATSILMTKFYTYLINGVEKHKALWKAMMDVRDKYHDPYYWAGFVMLD